MMHDATEITFLLRELHSLDSFADHALEALGCMVERRAGGETAISLTSPLHPC